MISIRGMRVLPMSVAAVVIAAIFVALQVWTVDYGTKINDPPYIRDYPVSPSSLTGSALDRPFVVSRRGSPRETLDKWMARFKLYSVDADEMVNVMALARIKPSSGQFDPHFYQYGGAWLYPLGAWYGALNKAGIVRIGSLETMLADPDRMDKVYEFGRIFVVLSVAAAGLLLFATIWEVASPSAALGGMALFLFCPATIYFSLSMKPHWYALVFVSSALLVLTRSCIRDGLSIACEAILGASLGFAVGSAVSFGGFAFFVWLALAIMARRGVARPLALVRVPVIAISFFAATNPFVFLDRLAAQGEAAQTAGWYLPSFEPARLGEFVWNSLLPGYGIAVIALLTIVLSREIVRPSFSGARLVALGIIAALLFVASVTANMAFWNINYRYAAYTLPAGILLIATSSMRGRTAAIVLALCATLVQVIPLKLAMKDENDSVHGTRLAAARWIENNIPAGTGVCVGTTTPVPFDVPPFDMSRYEVNGPGCHFLVRVERYATELPLSDGFEPIREFRPRFFVDGFALTFGHINPRITIYRRT